MDIVNLNKANYMDYKLHLILMDLRDNSLLLLMEISKELIDI